MKKAAALPYFNEDLIQMNTILEQLNPEQLKPVLETEGATLVLAGAGSGKTRVLTSRIAYLIEEKGVLPSSILAITFTNKAANEMKERIAAVTDSSGMWVCTIHSMCVRILREFSDRIGLNPNFSIYSEAEKTNVVKQSFLQSGYDDDKLLKNVKWHIGNAKMLGLSPEEYKKEYSYDRNIDEIVKVYAAYNDHLRKNQALDFDDLLLEARKLLLRNDEARDYLAGRFRYILVDEFQDTNGVQFDIIKALASVHKNLFVVGDDDQSIYGWRGAKIENILNFEKTFPDAKTFKLEQNYRSTKAILNLANAVIRHNGKRKSKTLWTQNDDGSDVEYYEADNETDEALYTVKNIARMVNQGAKFSDFAVLMRINALTRSYEQEFAKYGIPYKVFGGFKFFERKEIKDLLAYLRIVNNPFDSEAIIRVVNFPRRGIGDKTIKVLQEYADANELSVYDAFLDLDELPLNAGTKAKLSAFADLMKDLILKSQELSVEELVKYLIETTKMKEVYSDNSDESLTKRANIDEFVNSIEEFARLNEGATLADYLNQVTLSSDTDEMDDSEYVALATIHSVKGLEFKDVFICGLEENIMPTSRAFDDKDSMEEERRLMYVAITRAKERLWLTRSKSRYLYGKREPTVRSEFLDEVSDLLNIRRSAPAYRRYQGDGDYGGGYGSYEEDRDGSRGSSYEGVRRRSYSSYESGNSYSSSYGASSYTRRSDDYGGRNSFGSGRSGSVYGIGREREASKPSSKGFSRASVGGSSRSAGAPKTVNDASAFSVGVKVKHAKFGAGVVTATSGSAKNLIIDVKFDTVGVKKLSASLAPLTIIG